MPTHCEYCGLGSDCQCDYQFADLMTRLPAGWITTTQIRDCALAIGYFAQILGRGGYRVITSDLPAFLSSRVGRTYGVFRMERGKTARRKQHYRVVDIFAAPGSGLRDCERAGGHCLICGGVPREFDCREVFARFLATIPAGYAMQINDLLTIAEQIMPWVFTGSNGLHGRVCKLGRIIAARDGKPFVDATGTPRAIWMRGVPRRVYRVAIVPAQVPAPEIPNEVPCDTQQ